MQILVQETTAFADNLTVYDAAYVALAKLVGMTLCTQDGGLAKVARAERLSVLMPDVDTVEDWLREAAAQP